MLVKHYAPNHMPDPKGEWSLKENNSELHYGICSKVNQFIYILVCNYMPNIRIQALAVLQIFCSQGSSYIAEKGAQLRNNKTVGGKKSTGPLIFHVHATYKISRILFTRLFLYKKCLCPKKGNYSTENLRNRFKS